MIPLIVEVAMSDRTRPSARRRGIWLLALFSVLLIGLTPLARATRALEPAAPALPAAVAWTDFAPAGWVNTLPTAVQVTAQAPGGFTADSAAYAVSTDGGASWSTPTTASLTVSGDGATRTLSVAGLTWPDSAAQNLIRFQIEETGVGLAFSPDYVVRVDTAAPGSTITAPVDGAAWRTAPAITGAAVDSVSGVAGVAISIRALATGLYWQGAGWAAGEHWLAAAGAISWAFADPQPAWTDGAAYAIRSRATDAAGNVETPGSGVTFTYDVTPPAVTLLRPNGGAVWAGGRTYTITWAAADTVGLAATPITLTYSLNGGATWQVIAASQANAGITDWILPTVDTGQALVEVEAVDRAGNRASDRSNAPFAIDSTPPAAPQNLQVSPAGWTNAATFSATWVNPADFAPIAGAWYRLDAAPALPSDGAFVPTTVGFSSATPAGDGLHVLYVWLQDSFGRTDHTRVATATLFLDRTPPLSPTGLQGEPTGAWTNVNRFAETWLNPPDLSGVAAAYYRLNAPGQSPTDGILVHLPVTGGAQGRIDGIEVPADGQHDLYLWLVDAAGNVDHRTRNIDLQVFWFDGTPPVSNAELTPEPAAGGWYSTSVTVSFSGNDGPSGSGVAALYSQLDADAWGVAPSMVVAGEGAHIVRFAAHDIAGNIEPTHTLTVPIDLTPPAVSLIPDRAPNPAGWYTAAVTLALNVADALSGGARGYYRLGDGSWEPTSGPATAVTLTRDGDYAVEFLGEDAAGNRSAVQSQRIRLDATPPATAYLIEGTQGQNGWYTSPLTVRLIPTDSGSGVTTTFYRIDSGPWQTGAQFGLSADGIYTLLFYSVDAAGVVETSYPVQVRLDTAAPAAPIAVQATPSGWSRANRFTVQWANPTDLSGIAGVYYRLNADPIASDDGVFAALTNRLDNFSVPAEGVHRLSLWLRDGAGNADHRNRAQAPLLRYDATPPTTTLRIQGAPGDDGWYRSAITLTLEAVDAHSGVAATRYRLNGGAWTLASEPLALSTADKHVFEYASEDLAGNLETVRQVTLRIDPDPPAAPQAVRAEPAGWQRHNSFRLLWREPLDQSGIAGIHVHFNGAPADPRDGALYPATELVEGVTAPGEGRHDVYVWLRDRAGNADARTAVMLPAALWYDGTPPATTVTVTGPLGQDGWQVGPVSFTATAADTASGVAETRWQLNGGAWTVLAGTTFSVTAEGRHTVRIVSADMAGNEEPAQTFDLALDSLPPAATFESLPHNQASPRFAVAWSGADPAGGSGLAGFEVQVRDGLAGPWQTWLASTTMTRATYEGQRGHSYTFRIRARDFAGNWQPEHAVSRVTVVDVVRNGSFDSGIFGEWTTSGLLRKAVTPTEGPAGVTTLAARLGSPDYGPSLTEPGAVPVGAAAISQTLTVPAASQVARPTLTFWYRVFTYDVIFSQHLGRVVDSLDVTLAGGSGEPALLLRAGNPTNVYGQLYDTGWQWALIDLTPYAGQTVQLTFANHNRDDNLFNTWSFVDQIQLADWPFSMRTYLPLAAGRASPAAASAGAAAVEPAAAPRR